MIGLAPLIVDDADLRAVLETLDTRAFDTLRRVLIRDQADRDVIASRLMLYRDQNGQDWADIIDTLTMHPEARRKGGAVARRDRRPEIGWRAWMSH
jgi:hypothetical protein